MGPDVEPSDILTDLTESETKLLVSMGQIVSPAMLVIPFCPRVKKDARSFY